MFDLNNTMNNIKIHAQAQQPMFCTGPVQEEEILTDQGNTVQAAPSKMCRTVRAHQDTRGDFVCIPCLARQALKLLGPI